MNVIQYKALLKTSVRLTCGEYHGTEHDPTSNQKVLDKGQEFEDHRLQIAVYVVSRSSTFAACSGARQVHGRPPALARCPRASVLCPFARGLRGLRLSTSRAVSLGRPTGARESARTSQGLLAVAAASAERGRAHDSARASPPPGGTETASDHKCRALVCVRGWGEDATRTKEKG
ncbi:hypothetical protein MSG28_004591 [Choristoneura fumiferana]|uniref:Uncharacterized protein n=1 Tax=Choristoneura fumiferana TaxID=7141 RepID=A0ACC0K6M5_CHOFU|nr:hypothetical protein MSG28_004591 [Choristoneura fumiferana]